MSGNSNSNNSSASNDRESVLSAETKLFGEISENNSTGFGLSKSSINSDDGDHIQVSDLDDDDANGHFVKEKNDLNAQKSNGKASNGIISPYYTNHNAIESIAVIDIDGDGEYNSSFYLLSIP